MPKCAQCNTEFKILAPRFYKQLELPEPTDCPTCRRKQRLAFWPYGILQKRKCDFSGETIISAYSPNAHFPVYKREHWFSDKWEAPQLKINWNRSFFDQLYELQKRTPHFHQLGKNNENCDYADDVWDCKNTYMSRSMAECEDVYYIYRVLYSRDCMDITYCYEMEQSYECTYCFKCYNLKFSLDCRDCSDSWLLYNCRGCRHCFMSWNLRNREYCILNKQYTKEEYEEKMNSLHLNSREFLNKLRKKFWDHIKKDAVHKTTFQTNCQNSYGNYISNCKNCKNTFYTEDSEDCLHVMRNARIKTCMDTCGLLRGEHCYGICQSTNLHNVQFAMFSADCSGSQYLDQCYNCANCFGCVGLKRKKYCILNKQYTKEKFENLKTKIIEKMKKEGEYGQFFPWKFAYNGYNLSLGAFYEALSEKEAGQLGAKWENPPNNHHDGTNAKKLPDASESITNDLVGNPYLDEDTKQPFAFIKQELDFYLKHKLPLPTLHPEERNRRRFGKLAPLDPQRVKCFGCKKEITIYYPQSWGYKKVACEDCYLKTVY